MKKDIKPKSRNRKHKHVLVTRQFEQSGSMINELSNHGHYPYILPMIETIQLCPAIDDGDYEVILFTSANAVKYFAPYHPRVHGLVYIAVGPKTAQAMEIYLGVSSTMVPIVYNMEQAMKIISTISLKGARILTPGAAERTPLPVEVLEDAGAFVLSPAVYETNFAMYPENYIENFIENNTIDIITFCSPSAVKSFLSQCNINLNFFDVISIGTTTYEYLKSKDIESRYPETFTVESMVNII